jgi:U3 small nucleolar RNA-associated protein 12
LTGSKDTFLKLWDLSTQHCVQTVVAHRMEVWTLDLDAEQQLLLTGSGEGELKAWKLDKIALADGVKETTSGEVWATFRLTRSADVLKYCSAHQVHNTADDSTACFSASRLAA